MRFLRLLPFLMLLGGSTRPERCGVPLPSAESPSGDPSFWGPAWGPIAPFSSLTHQHQKSRKPAYLGASSPMSRVGLEPTTYGVREPH